MTTVNLVMNVDVSLCVCVCACCITIKNVKKHGSSCYAVRDSLQPACSTQLEALISEGIKLQSCFDEAGFSPPPFTGT